MKIGLRNAFEAKFLIIEDSSRLIYRNLSHTLNLRVIISSKNNIRLTLLVFIYFKTPHKLYS